MLPSQHGMAMKDSKSKNTRCRVSIDPGADANKVSITFSFGEKTVTVPLSVGAPGEKKAKKEKKAIR